MKKVLSLILAFVMLFALASPAMAADNIKVTVGGDKINFDVQPQLINDRTMVPLRAIFEALGASVEWDGATQTVTSTKGDTTISLTIDNPEMTVNGKKVTLDSPACLIDGRTLVPVRAISEAFDLKVEWEGDTKTVRVKKTVSLIDKDNKGGEYKYDQNGNLIHYEVKNTEITKYEYDENGNEIYVDTYKPYTLASLSYWSKKLYDEKNNLIYLGYSADYHDKDTIYFWNKYKYDENNKLIYDEDSDGNWTKYTYDANGNLILEEDSYGSWTKYTYDANGNKIYEEYSNGWWRKYTYDANGNLILEEDSYGSWIKYTYDANENKIYEENSYGSWTKWTYDANGNKIYEESSYGSWTKYTYDANGNKIYEENSYGSWWEYIVMEI